MPETIGAIAYLARFGDRLRERLAAGYVVTCIGDPGRFTYKHSRRGDTLADRAALHVLAHAGAEYGEADFYPPGSDERQYCSPGFDLPVGSLMRTPYFEFPEYHTSLDDLEFVTAAALGDSLRMYHRVVEALEAAATYRVTVAEGEPRLGPRGLYASTGGAKVNDQAKRDMMFLLNYCDGGPGPAGRGRQGRAADLGARADRAAAVGARPAPAGLSRARGGRPGEGLPWRL